MASDRVIAMKHAQAAEDSANAMKQMVDALATLQAQNVVLLEKVDALMVMVTDNQHLSPEYLFDLVSAEAKRRNLSETTSESKPEITKKGK